ncbi:MAG: class I adenylate-forming enzyme family protein [Acidimicrobiales bacterium]
MSELSSSAPTALDALRLGDLPDRAASRWGHRPALVFNGSEETYAEFSASVDRVAKGLMAIGIESGDHVAVWMTNRPAWLHLMYAVPKVGGCLVPLNTRYRSDDMAYTVINSESVALISIDTSGPIDYAELLGETRSEIEAAGHLRTVVMFNGATEGEAAVAQPPDLNWSELLAAGEQISDEALARRAAEVDPDQLMMLAYTSGTTGNPKGVMHNHRPVQNMRERAMLLGHQQTDVHLNYLPLFHIYSLSEVAVMAMLSGAEQVLFETFDPDEVLDTIQERQATVLHGFDSHWGDLLAAQHRAPREVSSLRIGSLPAGMASTVPIARQANQVFCPTVSGFGMSECWAFICCSHPSHSLEQRVESSGYPMDGVEVEVRDPETGTALGPDEQGQLFIRNFTVMSGYWANPTATAATIDGEGWLDTGDVASIRADGHVVFVGRHKDMLKVGGENMSPAEVEGYLLEMAGVAEVAVVAFPDERLAEVPVAYVVRSKDADESLVSEDDLIEPLRGRIASYKIPRAVIFLDEMPMTPSGKIRKIELRERALADLA